MITADDMDAAAKRLDEEGEKLVRVAQWLHKHANRRRLRALARKLKRERKQAERETRVVNP